jgi:RNA-directed DNA polymerase
VLCGSVERHGKGEYMAEVRTSSHSERPCAVIEETRDAAGDAGGGEQSRRRKVHLLIDKVYAPANLAEAWKRVRENKGSAGIDGLTVTAFEDRQAEHLAGLHARLRDQTYRPAPVKRVGIPKAGGGTRNLGIPSVTDRVVQQALVQKMAPIFEPLFAECSFGYRPGRSPHMAMRKVWREINEGNLWILDADLRSFFDSIDQNKLVDLIAEEISDGRILHLIRSFLEAGVIDGGGWQPTKTGVPQGGVASPLWSNIFLTPLDHAMTGAGYRLTRWADDFVVVCRTRQEAEAALALAEEFLRDRLGVSLHPEKTRIVHVDLGFEFLGYKVKRGKGLRLSPRKRTSKANPLNLYAVPREKSVHRFKDQIRNLTRRGAPVTLRDMIAVINPIIRGWGNYYRKANVRTLFHRLDGWIERRLWSFIAKRWRNTAWRRYPTSRLVNDFGLVRLIHLVPGIVSRPRSSKRPHRKAACGKTARAV